MIICSARTSRTYRNGKRGTAVMRETMRLSKLAFYRGFGGDFRSTRNGGKRTFLPIVARNTDGYSVYPLDKI